MISTPVAPLLLCGRVCAPLEQLAPPLQRESRPQLERRGVVEPPCGARIVFLGCGVVAPEKGHATESPFRPPLDHEVPGGDGQVAGAHERRRGVVETIERR